ncbi:hypothetical protein EYF80_046734 [Liparis tanakae]|uniref:Uncharacterized protein n=1 Tax=Liparis tanakae TaxID=230148 RepID=A0A4Z2FQC9_9TELE|nr:hypothetical protein EYF80_046734 [Liparis tanakae]
MAGEEEPLWSLAAPQRNSTLERKPATLIFSLNVQLLYRTSDGVVIYDAVRSPACVVDTPAGGCHEMVIAPTPCGENLVDKHTR